MKFYKAVARPSLLYSSETWVTTQRDMTGLEVAEMCFLRSVTGYTRLDKISIEDIGKVLEISGIQEVRLKHKQNWINHVLRTSQWTHNQPTGSDCLHSHGTTQHAAKNTTKSSAPEDGHKVARNMLSNL